MTVGHPAAMFERGLAGGLGELVVGQVLAERIEDLDGLGLVMVPQFLDQILPRLPPRRTRR